MSNVQRHAILIITLFLAACATPSTGLTSWGMDLDTWLDQDLTPYLAKKLSEHPRFKGEPVLIIVMQDGQPTPTTNEFALGIRDRLLDSLVDTPGITLAWQPGQSQWQTAQTASSIDCSRSHVHYYIGIDVSRVNSGRYHISVRALDLEDQSWTPGLSSQWTGPLTTAHRRAFEKKTTDNSLRGSRELPFEASQTDLMAAYLAHNLTCSMFRDSHDSYSTIAEVDTTASPPLIGTVELVSNNLARYQAVTVTDQPEQAAAVLKGKAHAIDDDLYQYWITVLPKDSSVDVQAASTSAYVRLPGYYAAGAGALDAAEPIAMRYPVPEPTSDLPVIASLQVIQPRQKTACDTADPWRRGHRVVGHETSVARYECFGLQLQAQRNARLFLLNRQINQGLVRLSGRDCRSPTEIRLVRAGETVRFPDSVDAWPTAMGWQGRSGLETFYAVAVTAPEAAADIARHLDRLPERCTMAATPGLNGPRLDDWLDEFGTILTRWDAHVDWQAIQVRHVY